MDIEKNVLIPHSTRAVGKTYATIYVQAMKDAIKFMPLGNKNLHLKITVTTKPEEKMKSKHVEIIYDDFAINFSKGE